MVTDPQARREQVRLSPFLLHTAHRAFLLQSCVKFYTDSEEKVWEGCDKMSKGLEGPKSHDIPLVDRPAALQDAHHSLDHHCVRQRRRQRLHDETVA